jgi:RHS repeat-associated protein
VEETVYDDKGKIVRTINYNVSDPSSKFYNESVRDEKGRVTADIDITGEFNSAEYGFDHKGNVNVIADALGNKTAFGYRNDKLVSISGDCNGSENANKIKYMFDHVVEISSGGTAYTFTKDGFGREKEIKIAGENYSQTEYINDLTTSVTLANNESFTTIADKHGRVIQTKHNGNTQTQNIYDNESGLLTCSVDKSSSKPYNTEYSYDKEGRLVSKVEDGFGTLELDNEYGSRGEINYKKYTINGQKQEYFYKHDNVVDDKQIKIKMPSGAEQTANCDGLGRLSSVSLNDNKFLKEIYYAKFGDHATKYVNSVWEGVNGKRDKNTRYSYDKNGNITRIRENGKETVRYTYDSLNRLIREDNAVWKEKIGETVITGKTETYEYDNNGNILRKTKYPYTLSEKPTGGTHVKYGYSLFDWKDRLFSYNGEIFKYDQLGNPTTYRNKAMQWEKGRNLASYNGHAFTYNAQGIRTSKTINGVETTYYLDGTRILAEERRDASSNSEIKPLIEALYYHYGIDGLIGFEHRQASGTNTTYIYRKNIQGDITHIYNEHGTPVAEYIYDAWGNHSVCADCNCEDIATKNPFRYRGYYYDVTTNLYYLNSRYYDSQTGRFINADCIGYLNPNTINGLNLYAYCGSNPVMNVDPNGTSFWRKVGNFFANVGKFVGGVALAVVGVACFVLTSPFLFVPVASTVPQIFLTTAIYGGAVVTSVFHEPTRSDLGLIGWNPFNFNEEAVLQSQGISFYRGSTVFRHNFDGGMGLMGMVFLPRSLENNDEGVWFLRHEFGHVVQGWLMGMALFGALVGIPSLISAHRNRQNLDAHDNKSFERWATFLGGAGPRPR